MDILYKWEMQIYLSQELKEKVIYNFRANDIKNGGEGAPLTPNLS